MYTQPAISSYYSKNNIGKSLYDLVINLKPERVVEFGVLNGYSTISMAQALKDNQKGKIAAYDLWEDYTGEHTTLAKAQGNIDYYDVGNLVTLGKKDLADWLLEPEPFDLIHIDVDNTGDTIVAAYRELEESLQKGSVMVFEGGTLERDLVGWMLELNKTPMNMIKDEVGYDILDPNFPGLSVIRKS